ncbi:MAG: 16S rRNA (guanine(527)-N(7))-methyltransferase RsmG [Clostridia bacterium]|nr:16S rRNA (guanine(527)-N(7))-methyltransferase RsmG [Clostridia bacterium]
MSKFNLLGYECTPAQAEILKKYMDFLVEYNKNVNLTAITDEEEIIVKHFVDSLGAVEDIPYGANHIDVGSGAGFPAVVLKIFRPDLKVTMVESNGKKVLFLEKLIELLGLEGIEAQKVRAEDVARGVNRAFYDSVSARAVTELNKLLEYTIPLIKVGGALYAYKGKSEEELQRAMGAVKKLKCEVVKNRTYTLDGQARSLIIIKKTGVTPLEYPRHNKKIISNPL